MSVKISGDGIITGLAPAGIPSATMVGFAPEGELISTNLQDVIIELETKKAVRTSATGSLALPSGTTAERDVTPVPGAIRFNTETQLLESWDGSQWIEIGGTISSVYNYTGNGSNKVFTLGKAPSSSMNTLVHINGVYQNKNTYSLVNRTLTFTEAPPLNSSIEVIITIGAKQYVAETTLTAVTKHTGDGMTLRFAVGLAPQDKNLCQVFINGVYQNKSVFSLSGSDIIFTTAPRAGHEIEIVTNSTMPVTSLVDLAERLVGYNVYRFSGNGIQTSFVLGQIPASENNCQVYINGVYQNKNTFSVIGDVLQFTEAPPNESNNIEVVIGAVKEIEIGETDSSLVSFQPINGSMTTVENYLNKIRSGIGSPEGIVAAPVGTLYLRSDGGVGSTLYVKQSGTGAIGWSAK